MKRPLFIPLFLLMTLSLNNCTTPQRITFAQRAPKSYTMRSEGLDQVIEFSDGTTYRAGLVPYTIFTTIEQSKFNLGSLHITTKFCNSYSSQQ